MDPLSLLCRLATSVPPPRFHYEGGLASASPWRSRIAPKPPDASPATQPETPKGAGGYRGWAQLLARTFGVEVLACPKCQGAPEADGNGHRPRKHRPLPRGGGRGDAGAAPHSQPWPAVLEEPAPSPPGQRRRGRLRQPPWRGRRGALGRGQGAVDRGSGALCAGNAKSHRRLFRAAKKVTRQAAIGVGGRRPPRPQAPDNALLLLESGLINLRSRIESSRLFRFFV